jgi:hypothetical protein
VRNEGRSERQCLAGITFRRSFLASHSAALERKNALSARKKSIHALNAFAINIHELILLWVIGGWEGGEGRETTSGVGEARSRQCSAEDSMVKVEAGG